MISEDDQGHNGESSLEDELDDVWISKRNTTQQSKNSPSSPITEWKENIYNFMQDHPKLVHTIPEEEKEGLEVSCISLASFQGAWPSSDHPNVQGACMTT
eukprot:615493-Ditylum_brightwellii.AAC.1